MAKQWLAAALGAYLGAGQVGITDLLCACVAGKSQSLFNQLLFQVARYVELSLQESLKSGALGADSIYVRCSSILDLLSSNEALDHELYRYVEGRLAKTRNCGAPYMAFSGDKGNAGGVHLSFGHFVLPNNVGIIACPQVRF